jgi:uncharacterized membrane protein HdeD (DUF308 family)
MASQPKPRAERGFAHRHRLRGLLVLAMGRLAISVPFFCGSQALFVVGWLLIACGVLEMLETFRVANEHWQRSAYVSGMLSILAGILLLAQPQVVRRGLALLVAGIDRLFVPRHLVEVCEETIDPFSG